MGLSGQCCPGVSVKTRGCATMATGGPGGGPLPAEDGLADGGAATGVADLVQVDMMEESC